MGHKAVCLSCRKANNLLSVDDKQEICPDCFKPTISMSYLFRPPKKVDIKGWEIVKFLVEHGFFYQHIYKVVQIQKETGRIISMKEYVEYPKTMREAKDFVIKYQSQARPKTSL